MRTTPLECTCNACNCGIYTYNDSKICVACESGKHESGGLRLSYRIKNKPTNEPNAKVGIN